MGREVRNATGLTAAVVLLATPPLAGAHPPYEYEAGSIVDAGGARLRLIKAFTDGIVLPDPVTLEVRDVNGRTVAESPRLSDVVVMCPSQRSCLAFGYDSAASVLIPSEVWRVAGPQLTPATTPWMRLAGVAVHMGSHWLGYLSALGVVLAPLALLERTLRLRAGALRSGLFIGCLILGAVIWVLCLTMIGFSHLSPALLVVVAVGVTLASRRLSRVRGRGAA
jgi:hypothetical protein